MKILTLNIQKAYQPSFKDFFIRILKEEKYDFILLQEATAPVISMVTNSLSAYQILNPFDHEFGENTHVCILYKNQFVLCDQIFISFSVLKLTLPRRGWGFLGGIFKKDGRDMLIGTVHLHPGFRKSTRMRQISLIKEKVLTQRGDYSVIIGGDFNTGLPGEISG